MNEKLVERAYNVELAREMVVVQYRALESKLTISVRAVSTAQAMRIAQNQLPGWTVVKAY